MESNVTQSYRKTRATATSKIVSKEKETATNLDLADRIDRIAQKDSFLTLKDHKPNFKNNPKSRLINPSKSDIGIISKRILERINRKVIAATNVNQWKSTQSVIDWYKCIPNKTSHSFICFDIIDYYPSISEDLLRQALKFASKYDTITDDE